MKVLVCGAAGFIGSHVVDRFVDEGAQVIGVDSLDPGVYRAAPAYLNPKADYCFADLRTWDPDERCRDVEVVVQLAALGGVTRAAREPGNVLSANASGTARLRDAAQSWLRMRRFILVSSFSVYGTAYRYRCTGCGMEQGAERQEEDLAGERFEVRCRRCGQDCRVLPIDIAAPTIPLEAYGASKLMQELCLRGWGRDVVSIIRLSSVYGSRLRVDDGEATIIAKLAGWIQRGVTPELFEDGGQLRDWVYVGDVVEAIFRLAQGTVPGLLNVCTGQGTSLLQACTILSRVLGRPCIPHVVGGFRPGDMRHCLGDASGLRALLGRDPVEFAAGAAVAFGVGSARGVHSPR